MGEKEIYLPWRGFEGHTGELSEPTSEALEIARTFHPRFSYLSQGAKKLMGRNTHQVLGKDCMTPCHMIVCWTSDGKPSGGTGQAIRIAEYYRIPILNLQRSRDLELILTFLDKDLQTS
jgi:hypothetical protein